MHIGAVTMENSIFKNIKNESVLESISEYISEEAQAHISDEKVNFWHVSSIPQHSDKLVENLKSQAWMQTSYVIFQDSEARRWLIFAFVFIIVSVTSESETKTQESI